MPTEKPDGWDDADDGSRKNVLIDDTQTERHFFMVDGERYWFDVREPSWNKRNEIIDDSLTIGQDATELDVAKYYRDMLEHMIVDMSVEGGTSTFLAGVKPELGSKLEQIAPSPTGELTDEEQGNSDARSGDQEVEAEETQG